MLNDGLAIDEHIGHFITPVGGVYSLSISVTSHGDGAVPVDLYKNDDLLVETGRRNRQAVSTEFFHKLVN